MMSRARNSVCLVRVGASSMADIAKTVTSVTWENDSMKIGDKTTFKGVVVQATQREMPSINCHNCIFFVEKTCQIRYEDLLCWDDDTNPPTHFIFKEV